MTELLEKLESAQIEYLNALARRAGEANARERMKNILFNNCSAIIEGLNQVESLVAEVNGLRDDLESLEAALAEADADNARLKAELEKPRTKKAKAEE